MSITNTTFSNITITIDNYPCDAWGNDYASHHGVWVDQAGNSTTDGANFDHVYFNAVNVTCAGTSTVLNLVCDSTKSPECSPA